MGGASHNEETVEELLEKLAQKGKKVKLIDQNSASVKELPPHEEDDDILERDDLEEEAPSSIKKKMTKIKNQR